MGGFDPVLVLFGLASLLGSGIFHEQAHARVAYWLGDPTGKMENRFSWNPIHHIDPFMSLLLPVLLMASSGGRMWFAGMKPVRINPLNFRNPTMGMALAAAAGPVSNIVLATGGFLILWGVSAAAPDYLWDLESALTFNGLFLCIFVQTNVVLAAFNLLPLPGLDGSRILYHFLPRSGRELMDRIEPFALIITMMIVFNVPGLITPALRFLFQAMQGALGPDFVLAFQMRLFGR